MGTRPIIADNGEVAVKSWAARHYDAILMDRQMPVMDGLNATRTIREREQPGQHVWIIALTANALEQDRQECLQGGMDDYVSKPVSGSTLQAALTRAARNPFAVEGTA